MDILKNEKANDLFNKLYDSVIEYESIFYTNDIITILRAVSQVIEARTCKERQFANQK